MGTEENWHFEDPKLFTAFAVGAPGKRTFFLAIGEKDKWLRVWLEKEHLKALDEGVDKLLSILSEQKISIPRKSKESPLSGELPVGLPLAEVDVLEIVLGYEEEKANIEMVVQRSGAQEANPSAVSSQLSLLQLKAFAGQAAAVVAAGRPLCRICGGPIDPSGHVCPTKN
jgi:uncharacterized repeat protein (TIGR03847 family)